MTAYIADDEPLALAKLKLFLQKTGKVSVTREFSDGASLLSALLIAAEQGEAPDLVVVDVQMPGLTGMEVLERMTARPQVIITTAYEQYALPSFAQGVADYLLKPYTQQRLDHAVARVAETLRLQALDRRKDASMLTIRYEGRTERLAADEVVWIEAQSDYTRIATTDGRRRLVLETLGAIAARLPGDAFARVHRSYIINKTHVKSIARQTVTLSDGTDVPVGKTYREQIAQMARNFSTIP